MSVDPSLQGRTVVVSGGNGGIGLAIARGAGAAGARVVIWGRNPAKTDSALAELRGAGVAAEAVICDVARPESVDAAMAETVRVADRVDGFVANAAVPGPTVSMFDVDLDDWRAVIDTNLVGVFTCFRAAARRMIEQGDPGALVAVSSVVTRFGSPGRAHYAAAKAGVNSLVATTAVELARHRIRCNALSPGWTRTELYDEGFGGPGEERLEEAILSRTPARRYGEAEDYVRACLLLLDPDLSFHTGDNVTVDGGFSIA